MKSNGNCLFGTAKNLGPFGNGLAHRLAAAKGRAVSGVNARSLTLRPFGDESWLEPRASCRSLPTPSPLTEGIQLTCESGLE
jgi:hypothetical protein